MPGRRTVVAAGLRRRDRAHAPYRQVDHRAARDPGLSVCRQEPTGRLEVLVVVSAAAAPSNGLRNGPLANVMAIKLKLL
jgi:hypothetical protein